jgi:hypothetical protein
MKDLNQIRRDIETLQADIAPMHYTDVFYNGTLEAILNLKKELDAEMEREADMATAKALLNKYGYAFKIFTPDYVCRQLESDEDNDGGGRDIEKIVEHVVKGDDWQTMADYNTEDMENLWAIIEGTRGDHPEWFGTAG